MASQRVTALGTITPVVGDVIHVVDVSDTTDNAAGSSKQITLQKVADLFKDLTETLTNKTLTTPTIGDFTNANHTHAGASTGGAITSISGNAATATALETARTIGGVSFNGTANITVASATGGFTVSGGNLALGANSITMSGSIGVTGTRVTKGWFTDLQCTNAMAGSITGNAATVTNATLTTALTVNTGTLTLTANVANTSVLTIGAGAVSVSGANTGDQTNISGNAATATALASARTIGGVSFNGTANITVATATGGFTVSGGALALTTNNITMTGSLAATANRVTKGWFTDLESTNDITINGTALASTYAAIAQTMYIGTTGVAINRGTAALTLAGITLTTPDIGTPSAGTLTNCSFPTLNQNTTGTAANLSGTPAIPDGTTATTQSAADNSTKLATTAYADTAAAAGGATAALDNLASVAINTSLISDTDITDDLGTGDIRWKDIHAATLNAGLTATDTLKLRGRDVDGSAYVDILTITSANTVTADLNAITTIGGNAILYSGGDAGTPSALVLTNASGTAANLTLTTPTIVNIRGNDGWGDANETWTYASASTFTVAGVDVTAKYPKGTRLKWTQTTIKYGVVVASAFSTDTTITIAVNTDYTIANAAISLNYYSYQSCPQGYPGFFDWTPTVKDDGEADTDVDNVNVQEARFSIVGRQVNVQFRILFDVINGAQSHISVGMPTPFTSAGNNYTRFPCRINEDGASQIGSAYCNNAGGIDAFYVWTTDESTWAVAATDSIMATGFYYL